MRNFFYVLSGTFLLSACSSPLDKYQLPVITPSQVLVTEINNSRELIIEKHNSSKTTSFKIQFHGQSIVKGVKSTRIKSTLEDVFATTEFKIVNTARSGHQVPQLLPLIADDIYTQHADLLFFHAYGGTETGELEQYFKNSFYGGCHYL